MRGSSGCGYMAGGAETQKTDAPVKGRRLVIDAAANLTHRPNFTPLSDSPISRPTSVATLGTMPSNAARVFALTSSRAMLGPYSGLSGPRSPPVRLKTFAPELPDREGAREGARRAPR
jgi:hypothetical protein